MAHKLRNHLRGTCGKSKLSHNNNILSWGLQNLIRQEVAGKYKLENSMNI